MSYVLVDERGTARDFATNEGSSELYALAEEWDARGLVKMLDRGEATAAERVVILAELKDKGRGFNAVVKALSGLTGRVVVSNGVVDEEDEV